MEQMSIFKDDDKSKLNSIIYNEDVFKGLSKIDKQSMKLVITSPPYNLGKSYEKKIGLSSYLDWQKEVIKELCRVLKKNGSLCWQVGNFVDKGEVYPLDIYFYPIFKELGLKLRNRIIWHFNHGLHASKRLSGRYETLLWFTKNDSYTFNLDDIRVPSKYPGKRHFKGKKKGLPSGNPLGKNPSDFWELIREEFNSGIIDIPNVKANHPEKTSHPCQFPIELIERCVLAFTNQEDWILDPFAGVGTTALAALKNRRHSICIEKDKDYCNEAKLRIKDLKAGVLKTRKIGTKIHQPKLTDKITQIPKEWF